MKSNQIVSSSVFVFAAVIAGFTHSGIAAEQDEQPVMNAVQQFYAALNDVFTGDLDRMKEVWSRADDVTYMGPAGGFQVGWNQVLQNWETQAALKLGGKVEATDMRIVVGKDIAVVTNYEKGENIDAKGQPEKVSIRATSIFRIEGGKWKMIGHQTDLLPYLLNAAGQDDATKKDLAKLQGSWALVSGEHDGKKVSEEEANKTKIIFESEKFDFPDASGIGTSQKGTIKIDPSKNPKCMDSTATNDNTKGQVSLGIYEFREDHYRVCFAPPGKPRPTEFSSKTGSGHNYQVWKRSTANESAEKDLAKLQGTWSLVSGERDEKKVSEKEAKNTVITISGNDFVFPDLSKIGTSTKGTVKLDPTKNPKWIDSTSSKDGVKSLGIYEFVGNGYRVCFAEPGKDRPKDFSAKSGSGNNLQVWADSVEGTYVLVSGELKGQALAKEVVQAASLVIEGNKHKAIAGSDPVIGTHKLSPGKTPKEIDSQDTEGPNKGLTLGIYKYENGEFTVCFAAPGKDRPKEFTTKSGTGEFIHVWKKK